jgi:hypothetical protein
VVSATNPQGRQFLFSRPQPQQNKTHFINVLADVKIKLEGQT